MPLGLYIHLPWCEKKCPYCDFNSYQFRADKESQLQYVQALLIDAQNYGQQTIDSIFIGGGTPNLFSGDVISRLLDGLRDKFDISTNIEITMEANPNSINSEDLHAYRLAGVNRLSIGAQSFDDQSLKTIGRLHNGNQVSIGFNLAREAGFENINLDLMFGLPSQTEVATLSDLQIAIELDPDHLSWYQLTIEPNTVFFQRPPVNIPCDDALYQTQKKGIMFLEDQSYRRYEVSAFAKNKPCFHNLNYWQFGDYLGLGAGAHGKINQDGVLIRTYNLPKPQSYIDALDKRKFTQNVEAKDLPFEFMLNALRLTDGLRFNVFEERTGLNISNILPTLEKAQALGLLDINQKKLQPTEKGFDFLNDLQAMFLVD